MKGWRDVGVKESLYKQVQELIEPIEEEIRPSISGWVALAVREKLAREKVAQEKETRKS